MPNEVLKNEKLTQLILSFLNACFVNNVMPQSWQEAIIKPIPKSASKDPYVPLNYRGISLLSCFYKIYSSLLSNRITKHCEAENLIVDEQNRLRKNRSCLDHLYVLSSIVRNRIADNQPTFAAFIDFRKAFDWVDRDMLLYKLMSQFGVHGRVYDAIKTIYTRSLASVQVNQFNTEKFETYFGVKQGDVLSPTLFNMYLNDLAVGIKSLNLGLTVDDIHIAILLYADDIVLLAPSEENLQTMLNYVAEWCSKWKMAVNEEKTQIVHFRPTRKERSNFTFKFNEHSLELVGQYKYLGVILNEHMDFTVTASSLSNAASRALGLLRFKLKSLKDCRYNTFTKLYSSYICPILDYSAGVWGFKQFSAPEVIQNRSIRYFLGVHRFSSNFVINGDMGWLSCRNRRKIAMINLWNRLVKMPSNRFISHVFNWDRKFSNMRNTWTNEMNNLFNDLDLTHTFYQVDHCDTSTAYERLMNLEEHDWNLSRFNSDKLRYYNMYKACYTPDEYVLSDMPKCQRSILAQFRAGILPLEVEVGRFRDTPLSDRICKLCSLNNVEDEYHLLLECPIYADPRALLFQKVNIKRNVNLEDFDFIDKFNYLNSECQIYLASFLASAIQIRNKNLYE